MEQQYQYFQSIVNSVDNAIERIASLKPSQLYDVEFIEKSLILDIGLNNEHPPSQPVELKPYMGTGLHLWQYPSQMARYLVWLTHNAKHITSYCEIGCRWGGTFIVVNEWLKKIGAPIEFSLAVDPIEPTPFVKRYIEISSTPVVYLQDFSTSQAAREYFNLSRPQMVFIDGDHSIEGVMTDHINVRSFADIIVHHDVYSQACPGTTLFWSYARQAESDFEPFQFIQQYDSVQGDFLGIGALKRKTK